VRALAPAAIAAALLALAPVASAGARNACLLVTAADASKAVGSRVGSQRHVSAGGFNTCVYTLGKVTVTVKTRPISHAGYASAVKSIPGTALAATNISADAWVFFVSNGVALDDWKDGNELGLVAVHAGGNTELILAQLAKTARSRL
jgi:hypothetical protein